VPDRKLTLFSNRSLGRSSTSGSNSRSITTALSAAALAIAALAAPAIEPPQAAAVPAHSVIVTARLLSAQPSTAGMVVQGTRASEERRESRAMRAREIAWFMLPRFGWRPRFQMRYLKWLWEQESSWNVHAYNPYSGACGIPQAVPCGKMASAGPGYLWSARTQVRWGLRYIRAIYGSPRRAWAHECAYGWY
jgi:hypothetical protein